MYYVFVSATTVTLARTSFYSLIFVYYYFKLIFFFYFTHWLIWTLPLNIKVFWFDSPSLISSLPKSFQVSTLSSPYRTLGISPFLGLWNHYLLNLYLLCIRLFLQFAVNNLGVIMTSLESFSTLVIVFLSKFIKIGWFKLS